MSSVLITGSSSGIGLATALELARAGHHVYATMRKPDQASTLRDFIAREQLPITILPLDVTSDDSVAAAVAAIRSEGRAIEVLVNNAGIEHIGAVEELPFEAFRVAMETNYFGCLRCIRACLPEMRARKNGCIVNVSSVAGRIATSPMAPYTASKFALEALSEVLAQELKPFNIRVAVVEPGIIDTPMARRITVPPRNSQYAQASRFSGMFVASLATPTPPEIVAEKIRAIVESDTWQLRHPVGPDAIGFLEWRASMNDEQWVNWGALDDDAWYERVQKDFGLDARAGRRKKSAGTS